MIRKLATLALQIATRRQRAAVPVKYIALEINGVTRYVPCYVAP